MKLDVLRQPLVATLLLFAVLAILFVCRSLAFPYPQEALSVSGATPIENFLLRFAVQYEHIALGIGLLLVFANGLSISRILSQHMVLSSRSYLPIVFYLCVSCGVWFGGINLPALISSVFLLQATEYFILSFVRTTSFNYVFRGALLIGFMPLFYSAGIVYLLAVPIAMAVFRRSGRETLVAIVGAVLPLLAYAYIMWTLDLGFAEPLTTIWDYLFVRSTGFALSVGSETEIMRLVTIGITSILILFGLVSFVMTSGTMRTRARAILIYLILLLLVSAGMFFIPASNPSALALLALPVSAIIPVFFSHFPGSFSGIAYMIFLLSVITLNAYPLLSA